MLTFKKKDFKKLVSESADVNEFVDSYGGIISGDEKFNKGVDVKTGPINMPGDDKGIPTTTDDHRKNAIQPRNWWWSLSYGNGQGANSISNGAAAGNFNEAEEKMKKMVEYIQNNKSDDKDLSKKGNDNDVNRNKIKDIDELSDTKKIIVAKLNDLISSISNAELTGEEKGMIINHLANKTKTSDIPSDIKKLIKKGL